MCANDVGSGLSQGLSCGMDSGVTCGELNLSIDAGVINLIAYVGNGLVIVCCNVDLSY